VEPLRAGLRDLVGAQDPNPPRLRFGDEEVAVRRDPNRARIAEKPVSQSRGEDSTPIDWHMAEAGR
jgi:hypothetical protein